MEWKQIELGEILKVRGAKYKPDDNKIINLKRIDKINFAGTIFLSNKSSNTDMILIKKGDLVISGINVEKGAITVYEGEEDIAATIHYSSYQFDKTKIDVEFLKVFLRSPKFIELLKEQVPGGIKTEIKPKHILPLKVSFPITLTEQQKVATHFFEEETKMLRLKEILSYQLSLIDNFNQVILQDAVKGKLVAQNLQDEPASELLKRIKAEKAKANKKEKPLSPVKGKMPFDIPTTWIWCKLGDVVDLRRGKSKHRPRNDDALFNNGVYPFIQTGDVSKAKNNNDLITTINGYYNDFGLKQSEMQKKGTLCITIAANIAECGFLDFDACVPDSIVCLFAINKSIEVFIYHYLKLAKADLERYAPSTAQKNINLGILNDLLIPLPPLAEQARIVSELEKQLSKTAELKARIQESQAATEQLLKALLHEAFEVK